MSTTVETATGDVSSPAGSLARTRAHARPVPVPTPSR